MVVLHSRIEPAIQVGGRWQRPGASEQAVDSRLVEILPGAAGVGLVEAEAAVGSLGGQFVTIRDTGREALPEARVGDDGDGEGGGTEVAAEVRSADVDRGRGPGIEGRARRREDHEAE